MSATKHAEGRVQTGDGLALYYQSWIPEDPKAVLLLVHGAWEHSDRYHHVARFFAERGFALYGLDHRGHGKSPGPRIHVDRFEDYLADVTALREKIRKDHTELPLFLLGHSQGGLVSLRTAELAAEGLAGVAVTSPFLGVHPSSEPSALLSAASKVMSKVLPGLLLDNGLDKGVISRDTEVVRAYDDDPLVSHKASARWLTECLAAHGKVLAEASKIRIPIFVTWAGSDKLVDAAATRRWVAAAPKDFVEQHEWPELYHEILNEPENDQVMGRIATWLDEHLS